MPLIPRCLALGGRLVCGQGIVFSEKPVFKTCASHTFYVWRTVVVCHKGWDDGLRTILSDFFSSNKWYHSQADLIWPDSPFNITNNICMCYKLLPLNLLVEMLYNVAANIRRKVLLLFTHNIYI